ncbi:MAG TPA: DUF58 domain-containing protein [Haloferula sp.]
MTATSVIDPEVFLAVDDLELVGRGLAESVWHGRHGAMRSGSGTEFHRHRGYLAGDDLRRVNWALYARHKKLYTKESRLEARRPLYLLIDATGSMATSHGPWTKFHYAARVAAGISWLAECQGDSTALGLLRKGLEGVVERGSGQRHFAGVCASLASTKAGGEGDFAKVSDEIPMFCKQPGFVVMVSDFFDRENELLADLAGLKARGHDVMALQLLDPAEAELPEKGDYEFVDLESGSRLKTSVESLRAEHKAAVENWRAGLKTKAHANGIRWASATTAEGIVPLLRTWLDGHGL